VIANGTVDFGDDSPPQNVTTDVNGNFSISYRYADNPAVPYNVQFTFIDTLLDVGTATVTPTVNNIAPDVTLTGTPPFVAVEGASFILPGMQFVDFGTADTHTATINWGDGSPAVAGTVNESATLPGQPGNSTGTIGQVTSSHEYLTYGTFTVLVTVTDDDGGSDTASFQVTVANVAPVITPVIGPIRVPVSTPFTENLATFTDPGTQDVHSATILWGDAVGELPSAGTILGNTISGTHTYANVGVYNAVVTLTDGQATVSTNVTINVLPVVEVTAPPTTVRGQPTEISLNVLNPANPAANVRYDIDWDGDDDIDQSVIGPADGITVSHVFPVAGSFTPKAYVTTAGLTSLVTEFPIEVLIFDTVINDDGFLDAVFGGTVFADRIIVQATITGQIRIRMNNEYFLIPDFDGRLFVYGQGGSDSISVAGSGVNYDMAFFGGDGNDTLLGGNFNDLLDGGAGNDKLIGYAGDNTMYGGDGIDNIIGGTDIDIVFGGAGNDLINGGSGNDILDGGDGNDTIHGLLGDDIIRGGAGADTIRGDAGNDILIGDAGNDALFGLAGRDILIGGTNGDRLDGGIDDDILINSRYINDDNDADLLDIMAEWLSPEDFETRILALQGVLKCGTIPNDGARDSLYGGADQDWFLVYELIAKDVVSGATIDDFIDKLV
ncbi:MAG TPA: hypothetical protein VL096_03075, partial [Pirellulaceae bacterium]|nr:hypothetical protein [Pirellulaceae bacterium]